MEGNVSKIKTRPGMEDILPGLWIWKARHPFWNEGDDYPQIVVSTFVESRGETIVIDPLSPSLDNIGLWDKLDSNPPTIAVATMPDHIRDIDLFVHRYRTKAFGPLFLFKDQVTNSEISPPVWQEVLPGGLMPLYDARGRAETPLYLPDHRTIVFGDALTERGGELRVWDSPWHKKWEIPALRDMLRLPFERVIVSHFESKPVLPRADFEKALSLKPFR